MKFCKIAELQHAAMAKSFSASVSARSFFKLLGVADSWVPLGSSFCQG